MTCKIPKCNNPHHARGLCVNHHKKWLNYGDPRASRKLASLIVKVMEKTRDERREAVREMMLTS